MRGIFEPHSNFFHQNGMDFMSLDEIDRRILRSIQHNARRSIAELAETAGLSPSACHRRVKLLEDRGLITGYVANLDRVALGYALVFFVEATLQSQDARNQKEFEAAVSKVDEIIECYLMAGEIDYVMRVVASDVADFERIHRDKLTRLPHLGRLRSNLMIREVRKLNGLPIR